MNYKQKVQSAAEDAEPPPLPPHGTWRPKRERVTLADRERVEQLVAQVKGKPTSMDPLDWGRRLKAREEAGDRTLTIFQKEAWRKALRRETR